MLDFVEIARAAWPILVLLIPAACPPAGLEPPAPPSTTQSISQRACFSAADCSSHELCVDPRYPVCGNVPACEDGGIPCGCSCVAACTATSCAADEVCGASGCCEPRPCAVEADCGFALTRCVAGSCVRPGTCSLPPP